MKFINPLKPKIMGILKRKTCSISGKRFKANRKNFYSNANAPDGLHPYHKSFDNFRRSTGASVAQCRKLVNLINA